MATQVGQKSSTRHDSFITSELTRAGQRIRVLDITAGLCLLTAGILAYAVLLMVLDRALLLSAASRQISFLLFLGAAGIYTWFGLVRPLCWRVNPHYAARQLEQTLASNKNHLVNWVDLADQPLPGVIRTALGQRAAKDVSRADPERAFSNLRAVLAGSVVALLLIVLVVLLILWKPAPFGSHLVRAFLPFSLDSKIATRTQITLIRPETGDAEVVQGNPVPIVVEIDGWLPDPDHPKAPCLLYRTDVAEPYRKRFLQREGDSRSLNTTLRSDEVGAGFFYKITAGDAETQEYRIRAIGAPGITDFQATYVYRPYMGKASRTSSSRKIEDMAGTEVEILARTNRLITEGKLDFEPPEGKATTYQATLRQDDPRALRFRVPLTTSGKYRIRYRTTLNEQETERTQYDIEVRPDTSPVVRLTEPGKDIELGATGHVEIVGDASDDLGIASLSLELRIVEGPELKSLPYLAGKLGTADFGTPRNLEYRQLLELPTLVDGTGKPVTLKPDMQIEYQLVARDRCEVPGVNTGKSETFRIKITGQDNKANQEKEKQAARDKQKQHEKEQGDQLKKEEAQRKDKQQKEEQQAKAESGQDKENKEKGGTDQGEKDRDTQKKAEQLQKGLDKQDKGEGKNDKNDKGKEGEPTDGKGDQGKEGKKGEAKGGEQKPGQARQEGGQQGKDDKGGQGKAGHAKGAGEGQGEERKPEGEVKPGEVKGGEPKEGKTPGQPTGEERQADAHDGMKEQAGTSAGKAGKEPGEGQQPQPPKPGEGKGQPQGKPGEAKEGGTPGPDGPKPGERKGSGKGGSPREADPAQVGELAKDLQGKERDKAARDLANIRDQASDPATRAAAEAALKQAGREGEPGEGEGGKPGEEGNQGEGEARKPQEGMGEGKGGDEREGKGKEGKPGEQGGKPDPAGQSKGPGKDGKGGNPGEGMTGERQPGSGDGGDPDDRQVPKEKPEAHRATMMQLEQFKKKVDPDVLRDLKMTKEDFERFLRDYADLARRQKATAPERDPAPKPGSGTGTMSSVAGRPIQGNGGRPEDVRGEGRPKPPPEYRDAHSDFQKRLLNLPK